MKNTKSEIFNYLKNFMVTHEWYMGNTPEQARAMFTALCFIGYIDADTAECDRLLNVLYDEAVMEEIMEYDEFVNFMVELIV